jgi:hypothetical protein
LESHKFYFRGKPVEVMVARGAGRSQAAATARSWAKDNGIEGEADGDQDIEKAQLTSEGRERRA